MEKGKKAVERLKLKKLENSQVEIEGFITSQVLDFYRAVVIKKIKKEIDVEGFRKGNVPEKIIVQRIGEHSILEDAVEEILQQEYANIINENKIEAIGRPKISIDKTPVGEVRFVIKTYVLPEVTLADYKAIAKEEMSEKLPDFKVTDKEMNDFVEQIKKDYSARKGEKEMPVFDDNFVKLLGDFKDKDDFMEKIRGAMKKDKEINHKEKRRVKIMDKISEKSEMELPEILVESELNRMISTLRHDLQRSGAELKDYLDHIKKTEEDLRKDWRENAIKKVKVQLILNKISEVENIKVDNAEIKKEVDHIKSHNKDADEESARIYVETLLTNEKVFNFLENNN